jgi:hypothetical protein
MSYRRIVRARLGRMQEVVAGHDYKGEPNTLDRH